jgi:hypothetical protein
MNMIAKTAFLACVCVASFLNANGSELKEVKFSGRFLCPACKELQELEAVVPPTGAQSNSYEEWAATFVASMEKMIELVKSGKVGNGKFAVDIKAAE